MSIKELHNNTEPNLKYKLGKEKSGSRPTGWYSIYRILESLSRRKSASIDFIIKNGSVIPIMRFVIPVILMLSQRLRRT